MVGGLALTTQHSWREQRFDPEEEERCEQGVTPESAAPSGQGNDWPYDVPFPVTLERARTRANPTKADEALTRIYDHFQPIIYRYIIMRIADVPTAEDLTSETFFAMVERIGETRANDLRTFAGWMIGIAHNQVASHFRRQKSRHVTHLDTSVEDRLIEPSASSDPERVIAGRESWEEFVAAFNELTEDQRTILVYRTIGECSAEDVGRRVNKQAGAVRALQFRALATLNRILGRDQSSKDWQNPNGSLPPNPDISPKGVRLR